MSARPKLPFIDFSKFAGLNTKTSPDILPTEQLVISQNTDLFLSYGAVSKPNGMTRVLTTTVKESNSPVKISWVELYKAADLDGQILRHVLIAAGANLFKVESGGTTSQLTGAATNPITSARTPDLVHIGVMSGDFLFIQNQNPDRVGQGDFPVKYDGANIQRWGILAPGTTETVREAFSATTNFTQTTSDTVATESTITRDGASIKFSKVSELVTAANFQKINATGFDASASGEGKVFVWVYIKRGDFSKLATSGAAISVYLGTSGLTDTYRYDFRIGQLFEGWNLLSMDTDVAPSVALLTGDVEGAGLTPSDTDSWKFEVNTANATDTLDLYWDRLHTTDEGRLTATDGANGSDQLTAGAYEYKVTFVNKYGTESNAGPAATVTVAVTNNQVDLTNIPISSDPQVVSRKLYRTVADGTLHLFLDTINDNTTDTFTDTTPDLSLGNTDPPVSGSVNLDNSPPINAGIIKLWKGTVFLAGDPTNPNTVSFSEDDEPEAFPTLNTVTLDDKVTGMYETLSGLVIETETGKWQVFGDNPDFKFDKVIKGIGCVGRRATGEARLTGYAADRDGLYLYDLNEPIKISEVIRDKFDSINRANIETMHITHMKSLNGLYQFNADSDGKYTNNFVYQYLQDVATKSDLVNGWWWTLQLPTAAQTNNGAVLNVLDVAEIEDTNGDFFMYGAGDDGMLYKLFDASTKNFIDAAGTAIAITTIFQTRYVRPGDKIQVQTDSHLEGVSGRADLRFLEIRRSGTVDSNWTVTIDAADGSASNSAITPRDTVDVIVDFTGDQNLRRVAIPSSLTAAEYFRVKLTNSELNVNDSILAVRVYFHMRPLPGEM